MIKILILTLLSLSPLHAACVREYKSFGQELLNLENSHQEYVELYHDGRFLPLNEVKDKISSIVKYRVQRQEQTQKNDNYDNRYLKYYRYQRALDFLSEMAQSFEQNDYQVQLIGKSLQGRDLKAVFPKSFDPNKKLIVMFGRHHGDEGTANWIIEGFVSEFFNRPEILEQYQLVLYPMVNPDGAENRVRYNINRRDLNRSWGRSPSTSHDEISAIHSHLEELVISKGMTPVITLDMHGSFTEDFIYRVGNSTFGRAYFQLQQDFIDELGSRDPWQAGNYILSEGEAGMARIRLAKEHGWHTLTHETPRDIALSNRQGRSLEHLRAQGVAALETIAVLY